MPCYKKPEATAARKMAIAEKKAARGTCSTPWVATSAQHACIPESLIEDEVATNTHSYLYSSSIIIL
jgi:hypothetical protein